MPETARPRALIVDDEDAIRELLTEYLTAEGYDATGAATAAAGLAAARDTRPHVILLDLHLSGVAVGSDLVGVFAREAPVVVISGARDTEVARIALRAGAFDYITKPFHLSRVASIVAAAVLRGRNAAS